MSKPTGKPTIDTEALRRKYREERDKRLRPDGTRQYVDMVGKFAAFAEDPYVTERIEREPLTDSVDVIILGGGFSGLITAGRLRQAGVKRIRIVEKGGDFGGTWYWNRYPGIRCDVESYIYMPFLEEVGYIPTEKYAKGEEIFRHCQAIGQYFDLYSDACFQTVVKRVWWDETTAEWIVETDRGDAMRTRFLCLGSGGMHRPKLPGIPGIEDFRGPAFHTSRWDYSVTGGNADGNLTKLQDKRVGIIGTGASAIQCIPHLAEWSKELVVVQRTPSSVDVRGNKPTDPEWAASLQPGWQRKRMLNFTSILLGVPQDEDLVNDRWTDVWSRMGRYQGSRTDAASVAEMLELADFEKMEEIRARIDEIVEDKATAEALKPWYNLFCKRPLYSDEYLQVFNRPNVRLLDTDGRGLDRITEHALVFDGVEYPIDVLVYATGFRVGVPPHQAGEFQVVGRGGVEMAQRWAKGCPSLHGMYSHGFPNMFFIGQGCQASLTTNVPHMLDEQALHVAALISRCLKDGVRSMEVRREAEEAWAATLQAKAVDRRKFEEECTPSYFNNEGELDRPTILSRGYGGGPLEYIAILDRWRNSDELTRDVEFAYD
ncbi:cyclohexanone monooxygenase [Pseudonocardia thermophila]|uniref:Cyclohexanone monooxygenase n=1 Tax=Pseudonocardia thermophila TaxID=1848 RepID=A0A1M6XPJ6_PSETH|nr:NAD(P)/FAD-dependent oxidoreductase [Pseudonocardia thermophila]SHL07823.1 cyclohexanone monooxygenase [Pseudonocardia thermophila]